MKQSAVVNTPARPGTIAASAAVGCPVCGGTEFGAMFGGGARPTARRNAGAYRITQSSRALVGAIQRCRNCGLGLLPPALVDAGHYEEGFDERFAEQAQVRIRNAERLLELLPPPVPGARLLDVGCAYGFLLAAARIEGYTPVGVELSQPAAEHARQAYGVEVFNGPVQDAPFPPGSFDVITLSDVIEHFSDPAPVVARLHQWLRPNGRLLILTPDAGSVVARLLGRHWWALLDDHYWYFSRPTLTRFLAQQGFAVERLHSFGRVFPIAHWVFKLSQYNAGVHRLLDRTVRMLGLAETEVPLNLGDQMACVARRTDQGRPRR
ncbi:MAG: class I SAM-dependent methyltransferase [Deltaproteobacteria bacterium]|nr:class I SAM-dependent methyltransferase [Deltaproteobacteria bacterium]